MNRTWKDVIFRDYPKGAPITRENLLKLPTRVRGRGSVRAFYRRLRPQREHEDWRDKVLRTPLP